MSEPDDVRRNHACEMNGSATPIFSANRPAAPVLTLDRAFAIAQFPLPPVADVRAAGGRGLETPAAPGAIGEDSRGVAETRRKKGERREARRRSHGGRGRLTPRRGERESAGRSTRTTCRRHNVMDRSPSLAGSSSQLGQPDRPPGEIHVAPPEARRPRYRLHDVAEHLPWRPVRVPYHRHFLLPAVASRRAHQRRVRSVPASTTGGREGTRTHSDPGPRRHRNHEAVSINQAA